MKDFRKYILILLCLNIILSFSVFTPSTNSYNMNENGFVNLQTEFESYSQNSLNSDHYYSTRSNFDLSGDIFLQENEFKVISGIFELNGNITLLDNSTLKINHANAIINGWINITNTSKLIIQDSELEINPYTIDSSTTVINIIDQGEMIISNTDFILRSQPIETIVPYILSTDNSAVSISNSTMETFYPTVPLEIRWGTAGLLLLTGKASWSISNTNIYATMHSEGAYRWCILQANAHLIIDGVKNNINDPTRNAFIKPNAGTLDAKNSSLNGRMPIAVLGRANFINSIIENDLEIFDNTIVSVLDSEIGNIQIGYWSGAANQSGYASPELTFKKSKIDNIFITGNSSSEISNSEINGMVRAEKNAILSILNSKLNNPLVPLTFSDNVSANLISPDGLKQIVIISGNCHIQILKTYLERLTMYKETVFLRSVNSTIGKLRTYNNMVFHGELINSSINEYVNSELDGGSGIFNFTLKNSIIPVPLMDDNITTYINHQLDVKITLNNVPITSEIPVHFNNKSGLVMTKYSEPNGDISVVLPYKVVTNRFNKTNDFFTIETTYMGFSTNKSINLNQSMKTSISWIDLDSPKISNIRYNPNNWNSQKWIEVLVNVNDNDIKVISNVTLVYSTNGGKSWKEKEMVRVKNNQYEAIIPRQNRGVEVSFYIVAYDEAGNIKESKIESFEVGLEYSIIINGLIILCIFITVISIILFWSRHKKVKIYSRKESILKNHRTTKLKVN